MYREWADRFHLSTESIIANLKKYQKAGHTYDPRDINSVLDFNDYMRGDQLAKIKALLGVTEEGK